MNARQTQFIARLVREKDLPETDPRTAFLRAGRASEMTVAQASRAIDWLLDLPSLPAIAAAEERARLADVPAGRYALVDSTGVVKFYVVDRPETGKWAGRTFVKAQASDETFPIRNVEERGRILSEIAADPATAMIRYGHELGCCGRCGRTLTDEDSRAAGIGPECAKILGIDRTGASERAVAARVAEILAPEPAEIEAQEPQDEQEAPQAAASPSAALEARARLSWRETKALEADARADRGVKSSGRCDQMDVLPGSSWEDIFANHFTKQ